MSNKSTEQELKKTIDDELNKIIPYELERLKEAITETIFVKLKTVLEEDKSNVDLPDILSDILNKPVLGSDYYLVDTSSINGIARYPWNNDERDNYIWKRGQTSSSEDNAIEKDKKEVVLVAYKRACWSMHGMPSEEEKNNPRIKLYYLFRNNSQDIICYSSTTNHIPGVVYMKYMPIIDRIQEHMGAENWAIFWGIQKNIRSTQ